eukprot:g5646.t1
MSKEFRFLLMKRSGIDIRLMDRLADGLVRGMSFSAAAKSIREAYVTKFMTDQVKYTSLAERERGKLVNLYGAAVPTPERFGNFDDTTKYCGATPTGRYKGDVWRTGFAEGRVARVGGESCTREDYEHRVMQRWDGRNLGGDASFRFAKIIRIGAKDGGERTRPVYGILTVFNEYEQVVFQSPMKANSLNELMEELKTLFYGRFIRNGFKLPVVWNTDDCCADRPMLQRMFRELEEATGVSLYLGDELSTGVQLESLEMLELDGPSLIGGSCLHEGDIHAALKGFLEDGNIIKAGVAIRNDSTHIYNDYGKRLPKDSTRFSRWGDVSLSPEQREYACRDAKAAALSYEKIVGNKDPITSALSEPLELHPGSKVRLYNASHSACVAIGDVVSEDTAKAALARWGSSTKLEGASGVRLRVAPRLSLPMNLSRRPTPPAGTFARLADTLCKKRDHAHRVGEAEITPNSSIMSSPPQQQHSDPFGQLACTPRLTFWICAGASWVVWMFAVAAGADNKWIRDEYGDEVLAAGEDGRLDFCDEIDDVDDSVYEDYCAMFRAFTAMQVVACIASSFSVLLLSIAFFRPLAGGCSSARTLAIAGGALMVTYVMLQLIAVVLGGTMRQELDSAVDSTYLYTFYDYEDVELGPTFGVAVTAVILATVLAVLLLVFARYTGNGPLYECCHSLMLANKFNGSPTSGAGVHVGGEQPIPAATATSTAATAPPVPLPTATGAAASEQQQQSTAPPDYSELPPAAQI